MKYGNNFPVETFQVEGSDTPVLLEECSLRGAVFILPPIHALLGPPPTLPPHPLPATSSGNERHGVKQPDLIQ